MVKRLLLLGVLFLLPLTARALPTRDNDDSCDIAVMPAATLLLPYFEVDLESRGARTTRFTITNVTSADRIAHVTLWTDRGYPVLGFSVYLTGYDLQAIDLFDVIARGQVAPENGTGTAVNPRGRWSDPSPELDLTGCERLPGLLPPEYVTRMKQAFTTGNIEGCTGVGWPHQLAAGYATIDVVGRCTGGTVSSSEYWTRDLRYDNVLTGDYETVDVNGAHAQGGPLVHIRAVPEGGTPELRRSAPVTFDAGFTRTFYGRHQPAGAPRLDGRQPLPARFAAKAVHGGHAGYRTELKIWRDGPVRADAPCSAFAQAADWTLEDRVRFDEDENAVARVPDSRGVPFVNVPSRLPATSITNVADAEIYPQLTNGAIGGWMYLNLDTSRYDPEVSQAWVVSTMSAMGRFSSDTEAAAFGNGCSPQERVSDIAAGGGARIEPSPNVNRSGRTGQASVNNDDSCDIALLPAATLLLPYFEVDPEPKRDRTTLLSITNVSPEERIARVTLWTDLAWPVLTFNVFLTGYDVQSIDLYDVIVRGLIAPEGGTGTAVSPRGKWSSANRGLLLGACERLPGALAPGMTARMIRAFQQGEVPECAEVGLIHQNAVGYATIDLVSNCAATPPTDPSYWTRDVAFDNVLIGDYQVVDHSTASVNGAPLVHIRAVPEGGGETPFARTFYGSYAAGGRDGRQPLPSTLAASWRLTPGQPAFATMMEVWRERAADGAATCGRYDRNGTVYEMVSFDDRENAFGMAPAQTYPIPVEPWLPPTSRTNVLDTSVYPYPTTGATSGWLYFNLDDLEPGRASQAWVVATQRDIAGRSTRRDAAALGNGCSPPAAESEVNRGPTVIGPAPNDNP